MILWVCISFIFPMTSSICFLFTAFFTQSSLLEVTWSSLSISLIYCWRMGRTSWKRSSMTRTTYRGYVLGPGLKYVHTHTCTCELLWGKKLKGNVKEMKQLDIYFYWVDSLQQSSIIANFQEKYENVNIQMRIKNYWYICSRFYFYKYNDTALFYRHPCFWLY